MSRTARWGAELLIVAVLLFQAYNVMRAHDTYTRVLTLVCALALTALSAYKWGHHRATTMFVKAMDEAQRWVPEDLTWHVDDDGTRHALITTQGGELRSIALPDSVQTPEQALAYIIDELRPADDE